MRETTAIAFCRLLTILTVLTALAASAPAAALAQGGERIALFRSDIVVAPSGAVTVTETIDVVAAGNQIKRGIIRDFPTTYKGRHGETVTVGFEVLDVRRDGNAETFKTERRANGVRVRIGNKDVFIPPGAHRYTIVYRTNRQIGFFEDFDELYWNVTGSDWTFVIERALVTVTLPEGAEVVNWAAYTGQPGERGEDFETAYEPSGPAMALATTRRLEPGEGFTIAVAWPKGFVAEPTASEAAANLLLDNASLAAGLVGLVLLLAYFLIVWGRVGRDPAKGAIVPEYEPPDGFSPAAARYVTRMGFDNEAFTAAIVNMAVGGFLTIEEDEDADYTLIKTGETADLAPGERALARKLFSHGKKTIQLEQKNHKRLQKAQKALRESLKNDFEKAYFLKNTKYFLPGLGITLLSLVLIVVFADQPLFPGFMAVWLTVWTFGCYGLVAKAYDSWRLVLIRGKILYIVPAIFITAMSVPFLTAEAFVFLKFAEFVTLPAALALAAILLVDAAFYDLLKAPTRLGRRVMDRLEGFELYLSVAEKDRMNFHNPPERTPELFERFLPYALALGVEQAWSEQFDRVLAVASQDPGRANSGYRPRWYSGNRFHGGRLSDFASSLGGSFSGAIASSSTAPGSSSGSGGGGSSGGGGGGGGGSGW